MSCQLCCMHVCTYLYMCALACGNASLVHNHDWVDACMNMNAFYYVISSKHAIVITVASNLASCVGIVTDNYARINPHMLKV